MVGRFSVPSRRWRGSRSRVATGRGASRWGRLRAGVWPISCWAGGLTSHRPCLRGGSGRRRVRRDERTAGRGAVGRGGRVGRGLGGRVLDHEHLALGAGAVDVVLAILLLDQDERLAVTRV